MEQDTAKIRVRNPNQAIPELMRILTQDITEAVESLRVCQEQLRNMGMNLPKGTMDDLRRARLRLSPLTSQITGSNLELRQLRDLAKTTSLIVSTLEPDDVLNQIMDTVIQLTGAERGYILLRDEETGELRFRVARGLDREQLTDEELIVSNTIVNTVVTTGEPILTHNAQDDERFAHQDSIVGKELRSILAVPLVVQDTTIGVVYCDNQIRAGIFKDHDRNLLKAFADQAAVAIQNARLFEAARERLAEITQIRDLMDNIFTSIASGLISLNRENVITAFNATAEHILGVSEAEALGRPLEEVAPSLFEVCSNRFERISQGRRQDKIQAEVPFDGGGTRFWSITLSPLRNANGENEGYTIVLDDLTDSKQREAELNMLKGYLPDAVVDNLRNTDIISVTGLEREISVIFADVRGFTAFSELLDPEELMAIINKYLGVSSDAINLYEGIVDKYMGDAVTGLFNTHLNEQEDHAIRATRAALHMVYDVRELHEQLPENQRLFYGIGIHTGMAVLGTIGNRERREFSAIGDALDMSKLLQENADKGEIMVSPATYLHVKDQFEFEALIPTKTKGRSDFTLMYKLTGRKRQH